MGPWPFDRLLDSLAPICSRHDVFAQTGTSRVVPACPHRDFLGYAEWRRRLCEADVVVTHAGNTVRLVQRAGKVPIAVARQSIRGEMRDQHQVEYLQREVRRGRIVVLDGDLDRLPDAVDAHPESERRLLATGSLHCADPVAVADALDAAAAESKRSGNPFVGHPLARYEWAFEQLRGRAGRHLDLGVGDGTFATRLRQATPLRVVAADPHPDYLQRLRADAPDLALVRVGDRLPFAAATFDSVTMLDVLEHVADERRTLAEVHRVLSPNGLLVLTVPARHLFSCLDPDNAKFRAPRLHRAVYTARFGPSEYARRFVDRSNGLRGDMAWERLEHTNYEVETLLNLLAEAGFVPHVRDGANLFWRLLQVPALLAPGRAARWLDAPLRLDSRLFRAANIFITAHRDTTPPR